MVSQDEIGDDRDIPVRIDCYNKATRKKGWCSYEHFRNY